jgi:hypothetical protein
MRKKARDRFTLQEHAYFASQFVPFHTINMAKSTRSKVKRSFRAKKREEGVYAVTEAARLHRLNSKLTAKIDEDEELAGAESVEPDTAPGSSHF